MAKLHLDHPSPDERANTAIDRSAVADAFQGTRFASDVRKTALLAQWLGRCNFAKPVEALQNLRVIIGPDRQEEDRFLLSSCGGDLLLEKFFRSFRNAVTDQNYDPDATFSRLAQDRLNSQMLKRPTEETIGRMRAVWELPANLTITRSLTVTEPKQMSWTNRPKLGVVFIATRDDLLVAKIRVTEINHPNGALEWNAGITSYAEQRIPVTPDTRHRYLPGQKFRSGPPLFTKGRIQALGKYGSEFGATCIDLKPAYHHLHVGHMIFGAQWDEQNPTVDAEKEHVRRIDAALDDMGITGIRPRSWAVHDGMVKDPDSQEVLEWKFTRIIWPCG